ncbi:DinB family protein [Lacisediminihabitans changchengi]|uniref:DinB family protein n=1 Tax=Lacisediminihabitans changchengi TaxID=2787634 RepID=A0A934SKR5_9MICO|nr:DinB family protein [Lacisediminihabitans changchengi]MBK4347169.1 DinB family protein [Lacisediminihabitans changchengi]
MVDDAKTALQRYLDAARTNLIWKLDGLGDYDIRRPLVPTGTNLLGLVKHVASVEAGYLGDVFGRPSPESLPWMADDADADADMWATRDESRDDIVSLYRRVWEHSDATIREFPLDTVAEVPWWSEARRAVTLQEIIVHLIAETNRHAGHADIVRELIDGAVGMSLGNENIPDVDAAWRTEHLALLQRTAESFRN